VDPHVSLRVATLADVPALEPLIAASARALCRADYSEAQIEAALRGAFGVDSELIRDGTYFAAEAAGEIVACGGWSRRATLFGGDAQAGAARSRSTRRATPHGSAPSSCAPTSRGAVSGGRSSSAARRRRAPRASGPPS